MIILGDREVADRRDLGDDGVGPELLLVQLVDDLTGNALLFRGMEVNAGAILGADIVALTVERSRVMDGKENVEYVTERNHAGVKSDTHNFSMAGVAATDLAIAWIVDMAVA